MAVAMGRELGPILVGVVLAGLPGDRGAAGGIRYRFRGHEVILVMREVHGLTACPMCDTLHRRVHLKDGQRARCRVCGSELARSSRLNRARMIPLVLTCLLLFVTGMANIRDVIPFPRTPKNAEF